MENTYIRPLTPEIATDYLKFKAKEQPKISKKNTLGEDPKRFLSYREELIPRYFSAEGFCQMINDLRRKIWENKKKEILVDKKSTAFEDALAEVVLSKTKNIGVDIGIIKSLIGVLLHVFKDVKYKEYINQAEAEILDILSIDKEKEFTSIQKYEKEEGFSEIINNLKNMYFFDQELGGETNSSENMEFFDQAWKIFETEEIRAMPEAEKNKLYTYLYEKYAK
ncbi:MAG TPA: hypothetical protein PKC87_00475 [Candidatus Absconditabacterales bacterium]|nr:hypothetical protein [Candidatus Absconditabacterales bacterium]